MGTVYAAEDPAIGRTVAIKVRRLPESIPPEKRETLEALFRREARVAGNLSHPNIVTIYDVDTSDGIDFIVMEFVPGPTLKAELRQSGPLALSRALDLTAQICAALRCAHGRGVVHRDVKPGNIILFEHDRCKLGDFGIAHIEIEGSLKARPLFGSFGYMSPEQMIGQPVDHRSDLFSLGLTVAEMLSGSPMFRGKSRDQILEALGSKSFETPKGVPAELESLLLKALAYSPEDRHQSAEDFTKDLESVRAALDAERQGLVARAPEAQKRVRLLNKAACAYHPIAPALDFCSTCGKPICAACIRVTGEAPACFRCERATVSRFLPEKLKAGNLAFYALAGLLVLAILLALFFRR